MAIKLKYRIQKRIFSPDVIERMTINPDTGKEYWSVFLTPIGSRFDYTAEKLLPLLNDGIIDD